MHLWWEMYEKNIKSLVDFERYEGDEDLYEEDSDSRKKREEKERMVEDIKSDKVNTYIHILTILK